MGSNSNGKFRYGASFMCHVCALFLVRSHEVAHHDVEAAKGVLNSLPNQHYGVTVGRA